ncbi:MAG: FeoB-associated Cys-rich rane protein [Evtepia sp.]|jgi:uncharacterized membrane protein|nr:FeoB-associated Cys-rich rane protein [Evtepia sp.]
MLGLLLENIGTIVIGLFVLLLAAFAARSVYRNKKKGGCLGGCAGCKSASCCESKK